MKLSLRQACRDAVAAPQERWVHNLSSCTNQTEEGLDAAACLGEGGGVPQLLPKSAPQSHQLLEDMYSPINSGVAMQ
jgi:hypothetical protein